jgi:hypothetical protein
MRRAVGARADDVAVGDFAAAATELGYCQLKRAGGEGYFCRAGGVSDGSLITMLISAIAPSPWLVVALDIL